MVFYLIKIFLVIALLQGNYSYRLTKISVTISDGYTLVERHPLELYEKYNSPHSNIKYDISAKIGYLKNFTDLEYLIKKYENVYNNRWIFLIEDPITRKAVEIYLLNKNPKNVFALIWRNSFPDTDFYNSQYPIFIVNDEVFKSLKNFNIEVDTGNYFANIFIDNTPAEYSDNYMLIVTLTSSFVALILAFWWHYNTYNLNKAYTTSLQKVLSALPYLKSALSLLSIYFIYIAADDEMRAANSLIRVYLDTILTVMESIFKTIFWFVSILIASGWMIYRHILSRAEMRRFIGIYIFIYLSVCFDQIIDLMVNTTIGRFQVSELKNFIIYSILVTIVIYKSRKSILLLKSKYLYSYMLAPEYLPALALKIKMLFLHMTIIISFTALYVTSVLIQKYLFFEYSSPVLSLINNNSIELLAIIFYLFLFRSRRMPRYFTISYSEYELVTNGSIFTANLPSAKALAATGTTSDDFGLIYTNKKSKKMKFERETPFIIINPIFPNEVGSPHTSLQINKNESLDFAHEPQISIADKISIGFFNKK